MKFEKIQNKGQARLFNNQYLEYLTKTNPLVIWGLYLPVIVLMIYYSNATLKLTFLQVALSFLSGLFLWTLFEYAIHRYIFHHVAQSEKALKIVYLIHGNHHEYPRDKERLFMPPVPSLLIASVFFIFYFAMGSLFGVSDYVFAFFPGFVLGYLAYGTMHYAIHAWNPPFKWMKPLWRNHHLHHYKNVEQGFGVSSTLWDHVFDTMVELKNEKKEPVKLNEGMFNQRKSINQLQEQ